MVPSLLWSPQGCCRAGAARRRSWAFWQHPTSSIDHPYLYLPPQKHLSRAHSQHAERLDLNRSQIRMSLSWWKEFVAAAVAAATGAAADVVAAADETVAVAASSKNHRCSNGNCCSAWTVICKTPSIFSDHFHTGFVCFEVKTTSLRWTASPFCLFKIQWWPLSPTRPLRDFNFMLHKKKLLH